MRRLRVVALVLVAACGGTNPVTGLSPAPTPATVTGTLAVSFQLTFPPGFWEVGGHAYRTELHCPSLGIADQPPVNRFDVSPDAPPRTAPVYLRNFGASTGVLFPVDTQVIHPDTPTVAAVTLVGLTEEDAADVVADCSGTVVYDGEGPFELESTVPFSP